jgi:glycolate oxidase
MTLAVGVADHVIDALVAIVGPERVRTDAGARTARSRVPAPFPVHRWREHVPDVVVLPRATEEVSAILQLAHRERVPVVARAGGTGLTDGAVPERGGILLDMKGFDAIYEIDPVRRTATVGVGLNMLKLNERLEPYGLFYPDDPASYPTSLIGGRIGTSGWSLIGARYGHTRDLVLSFVCVLADGTVVRIGDGGGPKLSKSSTGLSLKHLFMGHQGTLGIATEATLKLYPKPEAELSLFWGFSSYEEAHACVDALAGAGVATFAGAVLFDEAKVAYLRRDDEAYIPQPASVRAVVCTALYGWEDEVRAGGRRLWRIAEAHHGRYLGDEISEGDWASRHDRYATPLHGRLLDGSVVPMSWHCEDAALNHPEIPAVTRAWHEIVADLRRRHDAFDDWGTFAYTSADTGVDYLVEIDVGIWEQVLDEEVWAAWVDAKRRIAEVAVAANGSISACHGACRAGDVDVVPTELGAAFEVMERIEEALDPHGILNPGKYRFRKADRAQEGGTDGLSLP